MLKQARFERLARGKTSQKPLLPERKNLLSRLSFLHIYRKVKFIDKIGAKLKKNKPTEIFKLLKKTLLSGFFFAIKQIGKYRTASEV